MSATIRGDRHPEAGGQPALSPVLGPKFALPTAPAATVRRTRLIERLGTVDGPAVVSIVAPAGYGKTTLLGDWAAELAGTAYVALDHRDQDPVVLLTSIATALDRVEPFDARALKRLASPGRSLESTLLPGFVEAIWARRTPTVLMLDDADHLDGPAPFDVLGSLMLHLPPSLRLAIAARRRLPLPFSRVQVTGRLLELDARALALDESAAMAMATAIGVPISSQRVVTLLAQTEGWPAAIYLGLRSVGSSPTQPRPEEELRGTERSLADYMRSELLEPLDQDAQRWLLRSSVLETMTGPLCDASLGATGSLALLRRLEDDNLLVIPLDARRSAYRYHGLFRDLLRDELEAREPDAAAEIRARAAAWCAEHGEPEQAVEYAHASGDMDLLARLVVTHAFPLHWTGRSATVSRWLDWFDRDDERERRASVAVMAGWVCAMDGRTSAASRWLASAELSPDRDPMPDGASKEGWLALLRGFSAPRSLASLTSDARVALAEVGADSPFRQTALILAGLAEIAAGSPDTADERMAEAVALSEARDATPGVALALGERASIAFARGDVGAACRYVDQGLTRIRDAGMEEYVAGAVLAGAAARKALAIGSKAEAHDAIARVNRLRPRVMFTLPVLGLQMRFEAIRAYLVLGDGAAARTLLLEVRDILRQCPDLGTLSEEAAVLERSVESMRSASSGPWALTSAELRLLAYLPTHLSFREIAERLYVSPHTIKSQAMSIYGKLGVSSRREAIELGVDAGLLDAAVIRMPSSPGEVG